MKNTEVKAYITKKIENMRNSKSKSASNEYYQMGQVTGMLVAFEAAGIISAQERNDIHYDILNEYF